MILLSLFLLAVLVSLFMYLTSRLSGHGQFTFYEFLAHSGVTGFIVCISAAIIYFGNTGDTQILNGKIVDKQSSHVSCEHDYKCNCYSSTSCTGSGSSRTCSQTEHCSTCYEHSYDVSWYYTVDYGFRKSTDSIARNDRRGLSMPPRWASIRVGEPASTASGFTNYIKAAPDSLIRRTATLERYQKQIPEYPDNIYDYYRIDRLVTVGMSLPSGDWNKRISEINSVVGLMRQANVVVVLVRSLPEEYFFALEQAWLGGKKNDVIVVTGVDKENKIQWVRIMAWTNHNVFKVRLRDDLLALQNVNDQEKFLDIVNKHVLTSFVRKPMAEFEYLQASITPTTTQYVVTGIVVLICFIGLAVYFHSNEFTD